MYVPESELRKGGQPVGLNRRRVPASSRSFAAYLRTLMQARQMTTAALAAKLGYADQSTVGHILASRITFPVKRAEAYAEALGLAGDEREQFIDSAHLSVCPDRIHLLLALRNLASPASIPVDPNSNHPA